MCVRAWPRVYVRYKHASEVATRLIQCYTIVVSPCTGHIWATDDHPRCVLFEPRISGVQFKQKLISQFLKLNWRVMRFISRVGDRLESGCMKTCAKSTFAVLGCSVITVSKISFLRTFEPYISSLPKQKKVNMIYFLHVKFPTPLPSIINPRDIRADIVAGQLRSATELIVQLTMWTGSRIRESRRV